MHTKSLERKDLDNLPLKMSKEALMDAFSLSSLTWSQQCVLLVEVVRMWVFLSLKSIFS